MSTFSSSDRHHTARHTLSPNNHRRTTAKHRSNADADNHPSSGMVSVCVSVLFALLIAICVAFILLILTAALLTSTPNPDAMITPLSIGILGTTALLAGLIAARRCGHHTLPCGLTVGVFLSLLLWILTFLVPPSDPVIALHLPSLGRALLYLTVVILSVAGSVIGGYKPHTSHRHHR